MSAPARIARENGKKGGRPKGSTTRPVLRSFFSDKELKDFIDNLKQTAKTDPTIMKFVAEQIFGKAVQPIGNDEGQALVVKFDGVFSAITEADATA